jgi:hypothetical protein
VNIKAGRPVSQASINIRAVAWPGSRFDVDMLPAHDIRTRCHPLAGY